MSFKIMQQTLVYLAPVEKLPQDIWNNIDSFLSRKENGHLSSVSKTLHRIMNNHEMWKGRFTREFSHINCNMTASPMDSNVSNAKDLYKISYCIIRISQDICLGIMRGHLDSLKRKLIEPR